MTETHNGGNTPLGRKQFRRARQVAKELGVTLGRGLNVNGSHGRIGADPPNGCGSYDLTLDVDAHQVRCTNCGAVELLPVGKEPK